MARGWESKSIEDQINAREAEAEKSAKSELTRQDLEYRAKRAGMLLVRAHTQTALDSARDERYRVQLRRALDHLDSQLAELDALKSESQKSA